MSGKGFELYLPKMVCLVLGFLAPLMHKSIAALMLGAAIEEGSVGPLETPVKTYLPEWQDDPRGDITLRQLIVMSSGLAKYEFTLNPFNKNSSFRFLNSADRTPILLKTALEWEPGSKFDYNDVNAALVGLIIERATGKSYGTFLQEKLWIPMGGQEAQVWLDQEDGLAMTACCLLAPAMLAFAFAGVGPATRIISSTQWDYEHGKMKEINEQIYGKELADKFDRDYFESVDQRYFPDYGKKGWKMGFFAGNNGANWRASGDRWRQTAFGNLEYIVTMKAWQLNEFGLDKITLEDVETPTAGPGEVLVDLKAASINYRDFMQEDEKLDWTVFSDGETEFVGYDELEISTSIRKWAQHESIYLPGFPKRQDDLLEMP